jgi:ankyrin repeat protein
MNLIKKFISINNNLDSFDNDGNNIIHKLVETNDSKILKEGLETLIKKKKIKKLINQKNYIGYTPLHCSITNNNQDCVQLLINNGADIKILTDDGYYIKWIDNKSQKGGKDYNASKKIICTRFI